MVRRDGWRDAPGDQITPVLPGRAELGGGTAKDTRLCGEAVLSRYWAGLPWGALPEWFGHWPPLHRRHRRGSARGSWHRSVEPLAGAADTADALIDATIVRVHQHAAGAKGGPGPQRAAGAAQADCLPQYPPPALRWVTRRAFT
jgi:transposase